MISETIRFGYLDELLTDGKGCKMSEVQRFCCKNVSLRRYGSFNSFSVLDHYELLMSTERLQNYVISNSPRVLIHVLV